MLDDYGKQERDKIMKKTITLNDGYAKKTVYFPNTKPEEFYTDIIKIKRHGTSERPPKGYVFWWDERKRDEYQYWVKPSAIAIEASNDYPLGIGPGSFRVIPWKDGRTLVIINNYSNDALHFQFGFWAGLEEEATA